jgi:hypothetical protein
LATTTWLLQLVTSAKNVFDAPIGISAGKHMSFFLEHLFFTFPFDNAVCCSLHVFGSIVLEICFGDFYTWFLFAHSCKYCSAGVCCFKGFAVLFCFTMRAVFFVICPIQTEYKQTFLFCNIFRRKTFVIPSYHEVSQPKKMWKNTCYFSMCCDVKKHAHVYVGHNWLL